MTEFQLPSLDQLCNVLGHVLSGDNVKIQEATKFLKIYSKKVQCVGLLTYIFTNNQSSQLRQLAAILVKRHMVTLYSQLEPQSAQELKSVLLQRFFCEEVNIIRTNIGQIIGVIAQQELAQNQWPELYQILAQQTQKEQELVVRQRGLLLLSLIFDYSGDALKPFYSTFYGFFVDNLKDQDKLIRVQTVKCLISLFDNIQHMEKKEAQQYKSLVEPILGFVDACLKEGDEDNAYHCFDAFSYLAEAKLNILDSHLGLIVEYAAGPNILLNKKCSHKFKECVIDFIYSVVENHKKVLQKNQDLLKKLIETICLLVAEPVNPDDYSEDEDPIQDVALWLVEILCVTIKKKKPLYALYLEAITQLINSNDTNKMNAGFLILAAISEGLQDQIRRNLSNPIMNVLIPAGLMDQRVEVRGACLKALTYFSEWLQPEILNYDHIVIPHMVKNLAEVDPRVREKGLQAIDIFAENMEEDKIKPYLSTLIPALAQLFLQQQTSFASKRLCLSSIGAIVTSSRSNFGVYLAEVSQLLLQILEEKDQPEIMGIKAEAITCLGKIAEAFPDNQDVQQNLVTPLASKVYVLFKNHNDYEIREACLSFFYNQANAQGEAFGPIFDQIIQFTIDLANSTDGISYEKKKKEGDFSLDTDSEDEEETVGTSNMRVKVTQLDEKAAAIHALGQFSVAVPMKFGPYFKQVGEIMESTISYFYENVRIQTVHCIGYLIEGLVKFSNGGQIPQFIVGLPCIQRFNSEVEVMIQTDLMQKLIHVLTEDDSYEAVVASLDSIQTLLKKLGPAVIDGNLSDLTDAILALLEKKTKCFGALDDDDEEFEEEEEHEEDEDEDTNETVFEAITDILPQMAKTLKQGFLVPFSNVLTSLLGYCSPDKDVNDNIQVIGCFAQLFEIEPTTIQLSVNQILPVLLKATEVKDLELHRNTAYCLSNFVEFASLQLVEPLLPQIIQTLKVIYDDSALYQAGVDNAAAALCKIIIRFPNALPIQQALDSILKLLPFKGDEEEQFTALRMLLHLGNTNPNIISPHMTQVIQLLLDGVLQKDKYKIKGDKLTLITSSLKSLLMSPQYKQIIEQTIMAIPDEPQRNTLIAQLQ